MSISLGALRRTLFLRRQAAFGKLCFIHINKCGGSTIENILNIPKLHDTAECRRERVGHRRWKRMTTFSIVRNPYSRVVSHFNYRSRMGKTCLNAKNLSLNEWVEQTHFEENPALCDNPRMFMPCFSWVSDSQDSILVDFIFHLETLDDDWENFRAPFSLPKLETKMNVTNATEVNDALKALSSRSLEIINTKFSKDFRYFGYKMVDL